MSKKNNGSNGKSGANQPDPIESSIETTISANASQITGTPGDDLLQGTDGNDHIAGASGDDRIIGGQGDDKIAGASGFDTAVFSGDVRDYQINLRGNLNSKNLDVVGADGNDHLTNVEALEFDNATIYLDGRNNGPVVDDQAASLIEDGSAVTLNVLANAYDFEGDTISLASVDASGFDGTVSFDSVTGEVTFDIGTAYQYMAVGETLEVTLTYVATDGTDTAERTITLTITGTNDAPVVTAIDAGSTDEDAAPFAIDLLSTASDVDLSDDLDVDSVTAASSNGARTVAFTIDTETGAFALDPAQFNDLAVGESETVTVSYNVNDGNGGVVANTATFVVEGRNDAPVVTAIDAGSTDEDAAPFAIDLLSTASDVDLSDDLDVDSVTAASSNGARTVAFTVDAETGAFELDPAQFNDLAVGESETVTVSYNVNDGNGGVVANTATVIVEGRNDGPTANDDTLGLTTTVIDFEEPSPFVLNEYAGFLWSNTDSYYNSSAGIIRTGDAGDTSAYNGWAGRFTVIETPDGSERNFYSIEMREFSGAQTVEFSGWRDGVEVESLTITLTPGYQTIDLNFLNVDELHIDVLTGTHAGGSYGWYLMDNIVVSDGGVGTTTDEDTAHTIAAADLLANDTDPDTSDVLSISAVSATSTLGATVTLNADGSVNYDPTSSAALDAMAEGETLDDTFTYTVSDGNGGFDTATVTLTVAGRNDAPVVTAIDAGTTDEDAAPFAIDLLSTATDVDTSDDLDVDSVTAASSNGTRTVIFTVDAETGAFALDPAQFNDLGVGESETVTVSYNVNDGNGGVVANTATFIVEGRNDAPVVTAIDAGSTHEDAAPFAIDLLSTASDVDTSDDLDVDSISVASSNGARSLSFTVDAETGAFELDPSQFNDLAVGESETVTVSYNVIDGNGGVTANTASFVVEGRNDGPVANDDVISGKGRVLFIDDDRGLNGEGTWLNSLETLGYDVTYEAVSANGNPINDLSEFDLVIWSNGDQAYTNLTPQNIATLQSYLDGGGSLLYAGGHNLYSEPNAAAFAANYLGVGNYNYNMPTVTSYPNATGIDGAYTLNSWSGGAYGGTMISAFTALGSTVSLMQLTGWASGQNDIAAVNAAGAFVAATWGFDINQLGAAYRADFLAATLEEMGVGGSGAAVTEDNTLVIAAADILANDTDPDTSDVLSISEVSATSSLGASVTLNADGSVSYDATSSAALDALAEGETLEDSFTYTISDGNGGFDTATVRLTVEGANDAPVVTAIDAGSTDEDAAPFTIDLLSTASDVDLSDDLDVDSVTAASSNGARTVAFTVDAETGAFELDPAQFNDLGLGESETVTVSYNVIDGNGGVTANTATFVVEGRNDGPVAVADTATTTENAAFTIDVLANDTDADASAVLSLVSASINTGAGSVSLDGNLIAFDPGSDFDTLAVGQSAQVVIDYTMQDEHGVQSSAQATVTVTGTNDTPTVSGIELSGTGANTGNVVGLALSGTNGGVVLSELIDTNGDGVADTAQEVSPLSSGSYNYGVTTGDLDGDGDTDVVVTSNIGIFTFTNLGDIDGDGDIDFTGARITTTFSGYDVALGDLNGDGLLDIVSKQGGTLTELTNLGDVNGNGLADDFSARALAQTNQGAVYGITTGDFNGDGLTDILTAGWSGGPTVIAYNQGDLNGDGQLEYSEQVIEDNFDESGLGVVAGDIDGDGDIDFVLSRWNNQNEVVYLNQGDQNGDGKSEFVTVELPTGGYTLESQLVDIDGDGDLDIVHSDLNGQIRISTNQGDTNGDGNANFTVTQIATGANSSYGIAAGDFDGDGDIDIYVPSNGNTGRLLTNLGDTNGDGVVEFASAPLSGQVASWDAEFLFQGSGSGGGSGAREDGPVVTAAFAGDDIDADDDQASLTYAITSAPAEGTVVNNGDGTFSFDPGADFQDLAYGESRTVTFEYQATDAHGAVSATETVTVNVAGVNDGPVIVTASTTATGSVTELADGDAGENATTLSASGQIAFDDVDLSDTHAASVTPVGGGYLGSLTLGALDQGGHTVGWTFEVADSVLDGLGAGEVLTQDYVIAISDDKGGTVSQTVTVTLNGTNDAPTAGSITLQANALGNGGFDDGFTGWNTSTATSNLTWTNFSNASVGTSAYLPGDDAVAILDFGGQVPTPYGTGYGPTITSDVFSGQAGDTVRFTYNLSSGGDHAVGVGYIKDAVTGAIVQEIFNYNTGFTGSTGEQTVDLTLASSGEYVIEFRVGSYDATGGYYVGARMDIGFAGILRDGVSEDQPFTFSGVASDILATASDVDGDSLTVTIDGTTSALGATVTLNADGSMTYESNGALDYLNAGEEVTDTITFIVDDGNGGTTTATAEVKVIGENDAPVIGGALTGTAIEATIPTVSGTLTIADPDAGQSSFQANGAIAGAYGTLSIDAAGNWSYALDGANAAVIALATGEFLTDTVTVLTADGTAQEITLTIEGRDLVPTVTAPATSGIGDAFLLTGFAKGIDPDIANSETQKSLSVSVVSDGGTDWYRIEVPENGTTVTFDIDYGMNSGGSFDPWLNLRDAAGNVIAQSDDASTSSGDGGSTHPYDSFLQATLSAGTYYIEVAAFPNTSMPAGSTYELQVSMALPSGDPIVLDLNGDGFAFMGNAVNFDLNNDGTAERLGWSNAEDGLLVVDLNGSGAIESGNEVISEYFNGAGYADSVAALASLDTNRDGVVDASDAGFADLLVWQDTDSDGVSDAGELHTLAELGIASISVDAQAVDYELDGQDIFAEGAFAYVSGETGQYVGIGFAEEREIDTPQTGASDMGLTQKGQPEIYLTTVAELLDARGEAGFDLAFLTGQRVVDEFGFAPSGEIGESHARPSGAELEAILADLDPRGETAGSTESQDFDIDALLGAMLDNVVIGENGLSVLLDDHAI